MSVCPSQRPSVRPSARPSVCLMEREGTGKPGSEKVRQAHSLAQPPTTITSDGGTDARMEGGAAKSSCSFQKTDLVDNFLLLFLILISPSFSLSLLPSFFVSPYPFLSSFPSPGRGRGRPSVSHSPLSLSTATPLRSRSPFQFIRIIPSDRKRPLPPSLRPSQSQSRSQPVSQSVSQSVSPDSGGRRERARKVCQVRRRRRWQGRCQRRRTRPLHRGSGRSARRRGEGTEPASASSSGAFGLAVWRRLRSQSPLRPE